MSAFATKPYYDRVPTAEVNHKVQHTVIVRTAENLRKLNELLAAGWRVMHSTAFAEGAAMVVIEAEGDHASISEFRQVFGAPLGSA